MRLSWSSDKLFDFCPRKFQLYKLLNTGEYSERTSSKHLMYGHAFGDGVAMLLQTGGNIEQAIVTAFSRWDHRIEGSPKYLQVLFTSLFRVAEQFPFDEYAPLQMKDKQGNMKPAMEVGARLWLDAEGEKDYYVLFADAVMLHRPTGKPVVFEVKTTTWASDLAPMYTNSPQSILYSLPLPYLFPEYAEHSWDTVYLINQITNVWDPKIVVLNIEHNYTERLSALMGLLMRYEYIGRMQENAFFPKTWTGICTSYSNVCEYYGICDQLAMTCKHKTVEEQNELDEARDGNVILDMHIQTLLSDEMKRG